jgi:beta-lactamase class A
MHRRSFGTLTLAALAGVEAVRPASAHDASSELDTQLQRFKAFPGTTSFRIDVGDERVASRSAGRQLFVASAIKTFILCQYLRDVEAGRISEDDQLVVDDSIRTSDSPVLLNLTGTTQGRAILEAMITHSDNTATDIALLHVGPDRVRSLIAEAGLRATLIPDSTRRFTSYNVGAPLGSDIGWAGVQQFEAAQRTPGPPRQPLNDQVTLASSASDLVSYYKRAMAGTFFTEPATLTELKRIQLSNTFFPDDTIGYAKGGSAELVSDSPTVADFHVLAYAGQMVVNATTVTFCFVVNWISTEPDSTSVAFTPAFGEVVKGCLEAIKRQLMA